jgi:hypothetical protein
MKRLSRGGVLSCKTKNRCTRAQFWSGTCKHQEGPWRRSVGRGDMMVEVVGTCNSSRMERYLDV